MRANRIDNGSACMAHWALGYRTAAEYLRSLGAEP
jgi:hypothetical protein